MSKLVSPHRRGFLTGLASLPLIGGGVTLIGAPTAAATPVTMDLLDRYRTFLLAEAGEAMAQREEIEGRHWFDPIFRRQWVKEMGWNEGLEANPDIAAVVRGSSAGTRAAVVLAAVGCRPLGR